MRICFVAPRSWPAAGGMEAYLRDLTRALAERHDVTVLAQGLDTANRGRLAESLAPPPPFEAFTDGPVEIKPLRLPLHRRALLLPLATQVAPGLRRYAFGRARIPGSNLYARVAAGQIANLAAGADVLHVWGCGMLGAAAIRAARRLGIPVAMTPFAHQGQWGDDPASGLAYRSADRVIALLETEAAVYRGLGVPSERIDVLGVCSPGVERGGGRALRSRLGIEGPLVLFIGVRRPYKGFQLLVEAAELLMHSRPDVCFAFAGPGPPVESGSGARIIDAGEVDEAERAAWLEAADILCLPSAGEIFPCTFLEAWSVGTPVLASDIPTLTELVGISGGGLTSPRSGPALAETLERTLSEPSQLKTLGENGHRFWLAGHTPEASATRHEHVYHELLSERAACAA